MNNEVPDNRRARATSHLFAIRLQRLATLTALGFRGEEYYGRLLARQVDWLTTLINSQDERFTYDLRMICAPDRELYTRGPDRYRLDLPDGRKCD